MGRICRTVCCLGVCAFLIAASPPQAAQQNGRAAGAAATFLRPLPVRIAKILLLPRGTHRYLEDYRAVVVALSTHRGHLTRGRHVNWQVFSAVRPELRGLILAINSGAPPTALLRRIMASVTIGRAYLPVRGRRWRYGTVWDRMFISTVLTRRSRRLLRSGRRQDAARWGRASLFLWSQEEATQGTAGVLSYWCRGTGTAPENLAALGLPERSGKALRRLYQSALKHERRAFARSGFNTLGSRLGALRAPRVPRGLLSSYLGSVRKLVELGLTGRPYYALVGLGSVRSIRMELARREHAKSSARMRNWVLGLSREVAAHRDLPAYFRNCLLRWIKEAMGP